ncbi:MAG TPA: hypothetical protein VFF79_15380 [Conexibacter sp.]|jgi:hypothetical protein|nr:hypothetical protein [Conexibacter sp.]
MKRIPFGVALAVCLLGAAASTASAKMYELGASSDGATVSCPNNCFVVTRTTALQVRTGTLRYPTTVPRDGRIVAFTLQLGSLNDRQIHFFNSTYGGTSRVQLTVLRAQPRPARSFQVVATTDIFRIQPFFGTTVQFPLVTSLDARKGDVVALSVPTWAPLLAVNLPQENGWRASRAASCTDLLTQTAQLAVGNATQYRCLYQTARVTYTATLIATPVPPRPPTPPVRRRTRR